MTTLETLSTTLDSMANKFVARPDTHHMSAAMMQPSTGWSWNWKQDGAPEQFFQASITKLYTTAMVLQLRQEGALTLDQPVHQLLGAEVMTGLHQLKGHDASMEITVEHLLRHTSGLPDYFEDKRADGTTLFKAIIAKDQSWTRDQALEWARQMPAKFAPGAPGKAHYTDTNYQLLGMVIEACDTTTYVQSLQRRILDPLGLSQTFLFSPDTLDTFPDIAGMVYGKRPLALPHALASFGPDGSMVATAQESVEFLKAFWTGQLFDASIVPELTATWNRVFFPLDYGLGVMRYTMPRWMSFVETPVFWGHSGASGVVAYYVPSKDLYVSLVANQVKSRSLVYRLLTNLVHKVPAS